MKKLTVILFLVLASVSAFAQTSISGRQVDARAFGAKCDNSTNDTSAITAAISAVTTTGGVVNLPDGTCIVTGLTVPGGVTFRGKGKYVTALKSTTNAVIVNAVQGSGTFAFKGPKIHDLRIQGNSSGASQIGLNIDDALYFYDVVVEDVDVDSTGSHGVYFGNVFSSSFKRIFSSNSATGYPFLFYQLNMPGNTFEGLYAGDVNATSFAGYRIRTGNIICTGCNGINSSSSNSWWAIVGDKTGTDGALSNRSAYFTCIECNIESSKAGGILHYYNSNSTLLARTEFTGDSSASGTYIALKYEIDTSGGLTPSNFPKGTLGPLVAFTNSPLSYYANSEVIHANDLPPVYLEGDIRQADGSIITSYRNTTQSRSEKVYRLDARNPVTTITASTSYSEPGPTNIEANCASTCTLTLPWPGYNVSNETFIYIRSINSGVVTINANSGGTINGAGSYTLNASGESILLIPHSASADYRLVGLGATSGASTRVATYNTNQTLTGSANFTYDGTTVLNQKAGGNPYFAANDTTNSITTRFGPLAGAPDRAIIGTTSNHPLGLWMNNAERWTINTSGHFVPATAATYNIGSSSLPINDMTIGGKLYWTGSTVFDFSGSGTPEGSITAAVGSVYRRTNGGSGTTLYVKESGSGNTGWTAITTSGGTPSLTATRVGYGDGSNLLTGTSDFTYNTSTKVLTVGAAGGTPYVHVSGASDAAGFKINAVSVPSNQGGLLMPFVGGSNSSGPGIWWGSSGSYASLNGIYLNNGFTFQGASSTHDHVKIAAATGTSSNGTVIWDFTPSSSLLTETLSSSATGTAHVARATTLTSTGTAAANFGMSETLTLENGSGSSVAATAIAHTWSVATAGSETGRISLNTNLAGAGVGEAFVVEGSQFYGTYSTANISGAATINFNNSNSQELTLTGNVTSTTLSNLKSGGMYFLIFKQDGTGSRTLSSTNIKVTGADLTITSTATTGRTLFICMSDGSSLLCSKSLDIR